MARNKSDETAETRLEKADAERVRRSERHSSLHEEFQAFAAYERLHTCGFFSLDHRTETDPRLHTLAAERCTAVAVLLKEEIAHIDRFGRSRYPTLHLQGDLGERAVIYQWKEIGKAENRNNPNVQHDHNPDIDVTVDATADGIAFAADSKVSQRDHPNGYYLDKLRDFDEMVTEGKLPEQSARLFVPDDQVPALKDAVDQKFERLAKKDSERIAEYTAAAARWKDRVSGSPVSSDNYRFIVEYSRDDQDLHYTDVAKLRQLHNDLLSAATYLRRRAQT
jgi:hypothetical protein